MATPEITAYRPSLPGDRRADRGSCDDAGAQSTDQRHVFNLSAVAQTPKFSSKALRWIASDWQFSPILKVKSGPYFTVSLGTDNLLNGEGGGNQRPNLVPGVRPYVDHKSVDGWLNPKAFAVPPPGTRATLPRNSIQGPGMIQLDLSISRTFSIAEGKSIQLRGEAFNLPNHLNPGLPVASGEPGSIRKNSERHQRNQRFVQRRSTHHAVRFEVRVLSAWGQTGPAL